jgi:hypothetical protein
MNTAANETSKLLNELALAKSRSDQLKTRLAKGLDITDEVSPLEKEVNCLETRAKKAMKTFGCVSPETRAVYRAMADMLIAWYAFKDSLPG